MKTIEQVLKETAQLGLDRISHDIDRWPKDSLKGSAGRNMIQWRDALQSVVDGKELPLDKLSSLSLEQLEEACTRQIRDLSFIIEGKQDPDIMDLHKGLDLDRLIAEVDKTRGIRDAVCRQKTH